jgi:3-vinyl bacteriochlorophyllide hydratase
MFTPRFVDHIIDSMDACPWGTYAGRVSAWTIAPRQAPSKQPLYTLEQRRRRDQTRWTLVQGVLAPVQFAVFLVSLTLVLRYLATGQGLEAATVSVVVKTGLLYAIMITGSIWEREVFGRYLFAPAFFWEDVFSILVLMLLALAAYASYAVNATQFLLKLRAARLEQHGVGGAPDMLERAR